MFSTLRAKLIFSYTAVALLCLVLAVFGTLAFARDYVQRSGFKTLEEKRALAAPLLKVALSSANRAPGPGRRLLLEGVQDAIRASSLRVILLDSSTLTVVEDTSTTYDSVSQHFDFGINQTELQQQFSSGAGIQGTYRLQGEPERVQYLAQRIRLLRLPSALGGSAAPGNGTGAADNGPLLPYIIVYAQPETRLLGGVLGDLRDGLLPAFALAILVSLLVAFVLARSISDPLARLAEAAAAMARGDYSQRIPVTRRDELGALTSRFNEMAAEVDRAHKMQRDFVANISHDLKTPLTSVQGFSQAMLDRALQDRKSYEHAAGIINTEAQRMSRLVSDLLDLSRLENGLSTLELRPLEPGQLISQVALAMQPQADVAGVQLVVRLAAPAMSVMADVDRLKQAFGNLIDNALKHTPVGGTVTIDVEDIPDAVRITVTDTGQGIPESELSRVLERFYQVDKSRSTGGGRSLGLGLAIAREIINAHRGSIEIRSQVGQGTSVAVTFPAVERSQGGNHPTRKRLLGNNKTTVSLTPMVSQGNGTHNQVLPTVPGVEEKKPPE
ncbi:MAG: HAMP domain-containing sensor histidine kinase [Chloroflexota bacterium]